MDPLSFVMLALVNVAECPVAVAVVCKSVQCAWGIGVVSRSTVDRRMQYADVKHAIDGCGVGGREVLVYGAVRIAPTVEDGAGTLQLDRFCPVVGKHVDAVRKRQALCDLVCGIMIA